MQYHKNMWTWTIMKFLSKEELASSPKRIFVDKWSVCCCYVAKYFEVLQPFICPFHMNSCRSNLVAQFWPVIINCDRYFKSSSMLQPLYNNNDHYWMMIVIFFKMNVKIPTCACMCLALLGLICNVWVFLVLTVSFGIFKYM